MENNRKTDEIKSWTVINSAMTGFSATILALVLKQGYNECSISEWCVYPVCLVSLAIVFFLNATFVSSKMLGHYEQMKIYHILEKWKLFAELSFGLGFAMLISSLSIITYKCLDNNIVAPFVLMGGNWGIMIFYRIMPDKKKVSIKKFCIAKM